MPRLLLFLLLSIQLFSCKQEKKKSPVIDYTGFTEKRVLLAGMDQHDEQKDTLAQLTLMIPSRLDSFYQWQHYSDCKNCGETKYRFADNHYDQYAESGFYWTVVPDSVYQLNLWHKPYAEVPDSLSLPAVRESDTSLMYNQLPNLVSSLGDIDFIKREFRLIDNRPFVLIECQSQTGYLTQKPTLYLLAVTHLKTRPLYFIAECGTADTTGFLESMYRSLLSLRITEN